MSKLTGLGGRLYSGQTSVDFIGHRRRWYSISAVFIILSIAALAIQGLHLGIEFKGGSSYTVTKVGATIEQARTAVATTGITSEIIVQKVGTDKIRVQTGALSVEQSKSVEASLTSAFGVTAESIDTQIIGPSWGKGAEPICGNNHALPPKSSALNMVARPTASSVFQGSRPNRPVRM